MAVKIDVTKYFNDSGEVLFRLTDVDPRYYYKLTRVPDSSGIVYMCYDGDNLFSEDVIGHIDDSYSWFLLRNKEKIAERLYKVAHSMAQKALINANENGC